MLGLKLNHVSKRGPWCLNKPRVMNRLRNSTLDLKFSLDLEPSCNLRISAKHRGDMRRVCGSWPPGITPTCMLTANTIGETKSYTATNISLVARLYESNTISTSTLFNIWWRHQMETFSPLLALCAGIHRSPVNSTYKGQWRGALMFSLICAWISGWTNNREAGDLRRHRAHYDVTVTEVYCQFRSRWSPPPNSFRVPDFWQWLF